MRRSFDIIRKNRIDTIAVLAIVSILFCTVAIAHDTSSYDNHSGYSHQDLQHDGQPCEHTATPSVEKSALPDMAILVPPLSVAMAPVQQSFYLSYQPGNGRLVSRPLYLLDSRFRE